MSIENATLRRLQLLERVGKSGLNIKHPDEFELYVLALELLDESGDTIQYFVFPVMPKSLSESQPKITNIKKTMSGVSVLKNSTFVPVDISLSGSFGRKFRILLGTDYKEFSQSFKQKGTQTTLGGAIEGTKEIFDERAKTGYGCCKIVEEIVNQTQQLDLNTNGLRTLIFHNLALGNSYVVEPVNLKFNQSQESNMIWNYNLQLKGVAPLESFYTKDQLEQQNQRLVVTGYIQRRVDNLVSNLTRGLVRQEQILRNRLR